jgi:hypothetical protein
VLKERMRERNSLAKEREALITQLQTSSNTDFLTGALNRRAFLPRPTSSWVSQRYGRAWRWCCSISIISSASTIPTATRPVTWC